MYNNFKTEFKPYLDTLKEDNTTLKNHFNNINHSTSYNLNNTELNDLLNLITYITLTNEK